MEHTRNLRGKTDWPEGKTPRVILPLDATPRERSGYVKKGYRVSSLTEKHLKILRILHPVIGHRFLPKRWILAHFPPRSKDKETLNSDNFGHELRDLMRKPNEYLYWPSQQDYSLNAGYKHGVYAITHKGAEQLGLPLPPRKRTENEEGGGLYAHDLDASIAECSLKFGARDAGFTFKMSAPLRYRLPSFEWEPDCHPMTIGRAFLPGIEFERRPKGGSPEDTDLKLEKIIEFMSTRYYETVLNLDSALIPIVSTTEARTHELMDKVKERLRTCKYILFKTVPDWARERHFPAPNGEMFTTPFRRVGHPPLSLETAAKGGAH